MNGEGLLSLGFLYLSCIMHAQLSNAPINLKPAGGGGGGVAGRAWGGDLIVIVGPGVGLLTDLAFPGEGTFEFVFAQRGSV